MEAENIEDIYTLSSMQQGMLFYVLSYPNSSIYLDQGLCTVYGHLNISTFEQACQHLVKRHPVLRTAFVWEGLSKPIQVVYRYVKLQIKYDDWRSLSVTDQDVRLAAYLQIDRRRGFKLTEPPLMRLTIIHKAENVYQLIWSLHHLIADAWSTSILLKEVFVLHEALTQNWSLTLEPTRPYRDYIAWLKQQDLSQAEIFWRQALQGFSKPTPLISDHNNESLQRHEEDYAQQEIHLPTTTTAALHSLARQHDLTLSTLMLGVWALLLNHYTGKQEVLFGMVVSGRPLALAKVETMVGLFINTLPIRVQVHPEDSFLSWVKKLQAQQLKLRQYEYTPLAQIQRWSDVPRGIPLFESVLVFQNAFMDGFNEQKRNLTIRQIRSIGHSNYPLTIRVTPKSELWLEVLYDLRRFKTTTITRILNHFKILLSNMVTQPTSQLIAFLQTINAAQREEKTMELKKHRQSIGTKFSHVKPKAVRLSQEELIKIDYLQPGNALPLVITPNEQSLDLVAWTSSNSEFIERHLLKHGGILFRNFNVDSVSVFEQFIHAISTDLLEYRERSTPRTEVGEKIYTSTEYPAHQYIALHNEFSYAYTWPMKICFHCVQSADQGGETPIADSRKVFQLLHPAIKERFIQRNIMYVRNYGGGIDLSWQEAFQTKDKSVVEEHCRKAPMEFEWKDHNRLRTCQVRQAVAKHPKTGEMVWFNQAHLFHISNLEPSVRKSMLKVFKEEDLPRNTYYGDGSPLETSVLDEIREAYQQAAVSFPWQNGDVLLLDNMLVAHGRNPFVGTRKVVVAMAEAFVSGK
jgi:alpha-ketoglutarate-dependent taurine dioxygenase/NRPS condensation-like uncharacterized protein